MNVGGAMIPFPFPALSTQSLEGTLSNPTNPSIECQIPQESTSLAFVFYIPIPVPYHIYVDEQFLSQGELYPIVWYCFVSGLSTYIFRVARSHSSGQN